MLNNKLSSWIGLILAAGAAAECVHADDLSVCFASTAPDTLYDYGFTARVSLDGNGQQLADGSFMNDTNGGNPLISADGRYTVFQYAPPGQNPIPYRHDAWAVSAPIVTPAYLNNGGNMGLSSFALSANGRYLAFAYDGSDLEKDDTNGASDVFVHDFVKNKTRLISRPTRKSSDRISKHAIGVGGDSPGISGDGRKVVFVAGDGIVPRDTNGTQDVYIHDTIGHTTFLVSAKGTGHRLVLGNGPSTNPVISADGRWVAFTSSADNLATLPPGIPAGSSQVYLRDLIGHKIYLVSSNAVSDSANPSLSADGRYVTFDTHDPVGLVNRVYVHDRASIDPATGQGLIRMVSSGDSDASSAQISADGRYVSFTASFGALTGSDSGNSSVGVRDLSEDTSAQSYRVGTLAMLPDDGGTEVGPRAGQNVTNEYASISATGRFVVFDTGHDRYALNDDNGVYDVFRSQCDFPWAAVQSNPSAAAANLHLAASQQKDPANRRAVIQQLEISNRGEKAERVELTAVLPYGGTLSNLSPEHAQNCTGTAGILICRFGDLDPSGVLTLKYTLAMEKKALKNTRKHVDTTISVSAAREEKSDLGDNTATISSQF